jgi:HAD superfamily hydrolase (TIGR01509 family)
VKRIKAVVFDCDGVLFDSSEANRTYYNQILSRIGEPALNDEQFAFVHMHTVGESIAYLLDGQPEKMAAAHAVRGQMTYLPFIRYMRMEPTLLDLLNEIRPEYKTAIATNRTDTMASVLKDHNIEALFDMVVSALDVSRPKPHPEGLLKILTHFGIGSREAVFVGDSIVDEQAARAAGIPLIAYRSPALDADVHIDRLIDIKSLLD